MGRAMRGGRQHGVPEIFELQRQDFRCVLPVILRLRDRRRLKLQLVQPPVNAVVLEQLRMPAGFNNPALIQHDDHIRVQDR